LLRKTRAVALLSVLAVAAAAALWWRTRTSDPLSLLVASMPRDARTLEGRITGGFAWAPLRHVTRTANASMLPAPSFAAAAALALHQATTDRSIEARRARAIALLFGGSTRQAVAELRELTDAAPSDARVFADYAAAECELAASTDNPSLLPDALAAVDTSLRLETAFPEALFNRALILEHLGLRDQAREAWERYLAIDTSSDWAAEARTRSRALAPVVPFRTVLEQSYARLAADPEAAHALARAEPQDARRYGETKILGNWADAEAANRHDEAERHLRVARELGAELFRNRGEGMLRGAVAAIDRADAAQRRHLVTAHQLFRDGQKAFMADHAAVAQTTLSRAQTEFESGGSPLALAAAYFVAHTYHALGDLSAARRRERELLTTAPAELPAHRAQLLWHLGLGHMSDGNWGDALLALRESVSIFERLGETEFATTVRELIAEVDDRTGDHASAWAERIVALKQIGRTSTTRLEMALDFVARDGIAKRQWGVATSFLELAADVATRVDDPAVEVEMRTLQARALAQAHATASAAMAIERARAAASRLDDAAARESADADIRAAEAIVAASPHEAVRLLDAAIEYHRTHGRRIRLPDMLLSRARAFGALGDDVRAAADLEAGVVQLETARESLPPGAQRWGAFDAAEELFEDAIALALRRADTRAAFLYAERARARQLLDALGGAAPATVPMPVDPDVAIVEYFPLPRTLIIFVMTRDGLTAVQEAVSRETLERDTERFRRALPLATNTTVGGLSRSLHRRLVEPIERFVANKTELVLVGGPAIAATPFAALTDRGGRFLIEEHALVIAPSASVYARMGARKIETARAPRVLVVANPSVDGSDPLPAADREASAVASLYADATRLTNSSATAMAFTAGASAANVIHLATHGVLPDDKRGNAGLMFTGGRLDVPAIAALRLTRTTTVVVAACSSARGPVRPEGTISVARAFLAAGVPSVVATLWDIDDDQSARFFPLVHAQLARGVRAADALRTAQLEAIHDGDPPALWAAVQLIGS